ncbi:MAG: hypothetical protein NZM10_01125 [Fimbriimonadales bacterium]|nr:hypothetical protein [Fimbriimonadales bacterium]
MPSWHDGVVLFVVLGTVLAALHKRRTLSEGKRHLLRLYSFVVLLGVIVALSRGLAPLGNEWLATVVALVGAIATVLFALLLLMTFLFWLNGNLEEG